MSAPPLRYRVATHMQSFKNDTNQTELSSKVKELSRNNVNNKVVFKLLENKPSYNPKAGKCSLCTAEKYQILFSGLPNLINKKNEITNKCRHRAKFKLIAQ